MLEAEYSRGAPGLGGKNKQSEKPYSKLNLTCQGRNKTSDFENLYLLKY